MPIFDPEDAYLLVDRPQYEEDDCPGCAGTGEGQTDYTVCIRCHGSGTVLVPVADLEPEDEEEDESEVAHG